MDLQEKRSQNAVFIWSVTICHLTPVNVFAWLWEACDEVFQRDLFPLCPPSVLDSIRCLLFGPVEQRWHLQRLFRTQAGSLPICCTWETSLEEGEDWQLFNCIWCLRSYTELPSTCLPVQNPQLFLLLLILPQPSGVCVTGMWFGSSMIVTQETCKDSGHWGLVLDPQWCIYESGCMFPPCSYCTKWPVLIHWTTFSGHGLICGGVVLEKPFIGEMAE